MGKLGRPTKEANKANKKPFVPTTKMHGYVEAFIDAVEAHRKISDLQLSAIAKVNRRTIAEWRQKPEFNVWMDEQLRRHFSSMERIASKASALAMQGSIDHMKWLAQVRGWFKQADPDTQGSGQTTVIVAPPGSDETFVKAQKASIVVRV